MRSLFSFTSIVACDRSQIAICSIYVYRVAFDLEKRGKRMAIVKCRVYSAYGATVRYVPIDSLSALQELIGNATVYSPTTAIGVDKDSQAVEYTVWGLGVDLEDALCTLI